MDISKTCWSPALAATDPIFVFCAVIAVLLVWRLFSKPDLPSWGRHGRRG